MSELGPAATIFDFPGPHEEIDALYQERGWTDGLPIVPPTEAAVREFLRWTDRDPRDVLGVLPPRQGEATVERVAANAVMAGCRPEYLPVVLAGIEALADPLFNLDAIQATTHPVAPLLVVNGPIAREIGLNAGYNAFGQGFRANVTIGRAVRLVLMNVGGGLPGSGDRATQGSPAKLAYCVAENEAESPWEPLHVEAGFPRDVSVVTVFGCEGPHNIQDHYSNTGLGGGGHQQHRGRRRRQAFRLAADLRRRPPLHAAGDRAHGRHAAAPRGRRTATLRRASWPTSAACCRRRNAMSSASRCARCWSAGTATPTRTTTCSSRWRGGRGCWTPPGASSATSTAAARPSSPSCSSSCACGWPGPTAACTEAWRALPRPCAGARRRTWSRSCRTTRPRTCPSARRWRCAWPIA